MKVIFLLIPIFYFNIFKFFTVYCMLSVVSLCFMLIPYHFQIFKYIYCRYQRYIFSVCFLYLKIYVFVLFVCVLSLGCTVCPLSIAICAVWKFEIVTIFVMFLARFLHHFLRFRIYTELCTIYMKICTARNSFLYLSSIVVFLFYNYFFQSNFMCVLIWKSLVLLLLHSPLGCLNLPARCYSPFFPLLILKCFSRKSYTFSVIPPSTHIHTRTHTSPCPCRSSYFSPCFMSYCFACMITF